MRNLIIFAMLSLFLLFPMTINADMVLDDTTTAGTSTTDFYVSKNVTITYAVTGGHDGFTAVSSHLQGDALYGSGSDTTLVFKNTVDKDKGTAHVLADGPSSDNATAAFGAPAGTGNWSPM